MITDTGRIWIVIGLYSAFLLTELTIGFKTGALVLVADAFHCMNDIFTFGITLTAIKYMKRQDAPASMPFGYQRAGVLGAFFNGVFLIALSFSIFLQAIERFIEPDFIENPILLLIVGGVGFGINVTIPFIYDGHEGHGHGHGHSHGHSHKSKTDEKGAVAVSEVPTSEMIHDMEMNVSILPHHLTSQSETKDSFSSRTRRYMRKKLVPKDLVNQTVVLHAFSDAINNVGVMAASLIMMYVKSTARFYADPAMSVLIAAGICYYAWKMVRSSGMILLGWVPEDVTVHQVEKTLRAVHGVKDVHNVVTWALSQTKCIVTAHVVVEPGEAEGFDQNNTHTAQEGARVSEGSSGNALLGRLNDALRDALGATEIHDMTLQIEVYSPCSEDDTTDGISVA
ncbi:hypothetical protein MBLNU457_4186t2 [Dothideomycetes sp. NU457]